MTMKTKKTLQYIAAVAVVLLTLCLVFVAPVSAEEVTVTVTDDATTNGNNFFNAVQNANDGDTIIVPAGEYTVRDGQTSRLTTDKSLIIVGAGIGNTIFIGEKYGLVIDNIVPNSNSKIILKNLTIQTSHSWASALYVKSYANVEVEDVKLITTSHNDYAILLDSASINSEVSPENIAEDVNTVVSVKNVQIDDGDTVGFVANPCTSVSPTIMSSTHFTIHEGCNFGAEKCFPQDDLNLGVDNLFVNGVALNPAPIKIGEEGYSTLEAAVNEANNAESPVTITVLADVALDSLLPAITKDVTLDLGGNTITYAGEEPLFTVSAGNLTINAGQNGGITADNEETSTGQIVFIETANVASLTVNGGTYSQTHPASEVFKLILTEDHQITSTIADATIYGVKKGIQVQRYADVIVENCAITVTKSTPPAEGDYYCHGIIAGYGGTVHVKGGSVTSDGIALASFFTNGEITVEGAVITGGAAALQAMPAAAAAAYPTGKSVITVSSGTVNGQITTDVVSLDDVELAYFAGDGGVTTIVLTGGTFSSDPSTYVAPKYAVVPYEGKYLVQKMVEVTYGGSSTTEPEEPEQPEEPVEPTPETPAAPGEVASSTEVTDGGDVTFETPAGEDGTAPAAADDEVKGVVLPTGTEGTVEFVPVSEQPAPAGQEENTKRVFEINVPSYKKGEASVIKFQMTVAEIEADGKTAADVALWHYDEETGEWTKLVTSFIIKDGIVYFEAITNDFSPFAIVYEDEPAGDLPTDTPETPEQPEEPASPAPVLAVLAALGAAVVLRRK